MRSVGPVQMIKTDPRSDVERESTYRKHQEIQFGVLCSDEVTCCNGHWGTFFMNNISIWRGLVMIIQSVNPLNKCLFFGNNDSLLPIHYMMIHECID